MDGGVVVEGIGGRFEKDSRGLTLVCFRWTPLLRLNGFLLFRRLLVGAGREGRPEGLHQ